MVCCLLGLHYTLSCILIKIIVLKYFNDCKHVACFCFPGTAPRFTIEPEDRVVLPQRTSIIIERFPCSFDGSNIRVTWYRNDVVVTADSSHIIHDSGTLEITAIVMGVDATIAGVRYHCVLSNEVGSIRSRPALIQLACK